MMYIYPGDLRVFQLSRRSEVFVPASEAEASRFHAAFARELPQRFRPMIDILDEAFPRVAAAYRRAGAGPPVARIGAAPGQYDSEPHAVSDEIRRRTSIFDLKLDFEDPATLARFLQEYETLVKSSADA
jgi:hypothetical protein